MEVKVLTARSFAKVDVDGVSNTVRDVLKEIGQDPSTCTVRIDGSIVSDFEQILKGGETISAFNTKTIASAGVKGQYEVVDNPAPSQEPETSPETPTTDDDDTDDSGDEGEDTPPAS
jgi:sulfur carrier protein ThiS